MATFRRYLLSSNREVRKHFDLALVSSCDKAALIGALGSYQRIENTLEGELTGLIAALAREPNGLTLGRKTQIACGRLGLITGEITRIADLARKFGIASSTAGENCRAVLTRLAQASLIGALPSTPYLTALRRLLVEDADGRWLLGETALPASVSASGALAPITAVLIGWDVLRWPLPRVYADYFRSDAARVMPEEATGLRNYDRPTVATSRAIAAKV
jgi:hypothetical protein